MSGRGDFGGGKLRNVWLVSVVLVRLGVLMGNSVDFSYPLGVRFRCSRCGLCCGDTENRKRRILMVKEEASAIAEALGRRVSSFAVRVKWQSPYLYEVKKVEGRCPFLKGADCAAYAVRPLVCRFYPFELRTEGARHVFRCTLECPGIGKGSRVGRAYFLGLLREAYCRLGRADELGGV